MRLLVWMLAVVLASCGGKKDDKSGGGGAGGDDKAAPTCAVAAAAYLKLMSGIKGDYYIGSVKATPDQVKAATAILEADCGTWSADSKKCIAAATDVMKIGKCWKTADTLRVSGLLPTFEKAEQEKAKAAGSGSAK